MYLFPFFLIIIVLSIFILIHKKIPRTDQDKVTVVAYYFPDYHEDKRNSAAHGQVNDHTPLSPVHARFVVNTMAAVALFLLESALSSFSRDQR